MTIQILAVVDITGEASPQHISGYSASLLLRLGSSLALRAAGAAGGEDLLKSVDINRFNQRKLGKTGKDWEIHRIADFAMGNRAGCQPH